MATIAQVRSALATAANTATGIRATAYATDQVNPPSGGAQLMIVRGIGAYNDDMAGNRNQRFNAVALCTRDSERTGQMYLDGLCEPTGATSLKVALETNPALLALVDDVWVVTSGEQSVVTIAGVEYLATEFDVSVTL